ncbi:hypothetical protein EMIT0P253_290004 [Pseudomonas sp. IT-P253]
MFVWMLWGSEELASLLSVVNWVTAGAIAGQVQQAEPSSNKHCVRTGSRFNRRSGTLKMPWSRRANPESRWPTSAGRGAAHLWTDRRRQLWHRLSRNSFVV